MSKVKNGQTLSNLNTLCFELKEEYEVEFENLKGETVESKAIALIKYFENRKYLPALFDYCKKAREGISWDEVEG
ncbi:hypothetical protein MNBD_CHLOROFLEXI01-5092 [hydrothermal vent metagenome]|uniref:Effector-associated domain-containing protein n=1 Tax=hydrothermal vent metagenome TaxID=652676 RepID=A0A3B0VEJ5_9ZZZZ